MLILILINSKAIIFAIQTIALANKAIQKG